MKAKIEGLTAKGNNVYEDNKGRTYLADHKNRVLYAIGKDSRNQMSFYQQRHLIPMILLVLVGFYVNWYLAVGLALASIVVLEYLYNQVFLKSLVKYENIDIPSEPTLKDKLVEAPRKKIIAVLVMSTLLPILLVGTVKSFDNLVNDPNSMILLVVSIALIVYAVRYVYSSVVALSRQNQKA